MCCSKGSLPDYRPQPSKDGTCYTYKVQSGDDCWGIADAHYLEQDDVSGFNKYTWGWAGCKALQPGQPICLSKGTPPMPNPLSNAVCGPQVPGSKRPSDYWDLAGLNPCPLNACCSNWGFCGVTAEFCTKRPADTGNPGTSKPGKSSCISNCGTEITNNDDPPSSFAKVGYFEAFNTNRDCLRMDASSIDGDNYSHLHFAFASVTSDWHVNVTDVKDQFDQFVKIEGPKKILAFGGWDFSTGSDTFQLFRDATKPENREAFVAEIVKFLNEVRDSSVFVSSIH